MAKYNVIPGNVTIPPRKVFADNYLEAARKVLNDQLFGTESTSAGKGVFVIREEDNAIVCIVIRGAYSAQPMEDFIKSQLKAVLK